jgi:hypothetical protein
MPQDFHLWITLINAWQDALFALKQSSRFNLDASKEVPARSGAR